jgi:hypothetical protein
LSKSDQQVELEENMIEKTIKNPEHIKLTLTFEKITMAVFKNKNC